MQEKTIFINGKETPYLIRDDGTIYSLKRNRELKGTRQRNEYHTIYLMHEDKQYNYMVHRLVAEYFIPNPNGYTIIHHKDGDKFNNHINNLEWVTSSENAKMISQKAKIKPSNYLNGDETFPLYLNSDYSVTKSGFIIKAKTNRILSGSSRNGYLRVSIDGKKYSLHRLIYETFNGPTTLYIDHIDGNKQNNRLENLRAVSQTDNMLNAYQNGHKGQIQIKQLSKDGELIQIFDSIQLAADAMKVTHATIRSAAERNGTSCGYKWEKVIL